MGLTKRDVEVYECPSCGSITRQEEVSCCGEPMEMVNMTVRYNQPELEQVAKAVFDISSTELVVCKALMAEGEATIDDLTTQVPRDRSAIQRHINHLVELGVVEKKSQVLKEGGRVHVYSSAPVEEIYRAFRLGLYMWLDDAEDLLDELSQGKLEAMVEQADGEIANEPESSSAEEIESSLFKRLLGR